MTSFTKRIICALALTLATSSIFAADTLPASCHTYGWFIASIDRQTITPVAANVCATSVVFPNCYPYDCFPVYPPRALYNQWIPGTPTPTFLGLPMCWPCGDPTAPPLGEYWRALGYQSGDPIWITASTTRQTAYFQVRHDSSAPPNDPPTGVPHADAAGGFPRFGPTSIGTVP